MRHHRINNVPLFIGIALLGLLSACDPEISDDPRILARLPETVDYNFHIKPLLADRCYACHGPDDKVRKAELFLNTWAGLFEDELQSGGHAVVPNRLGKSKIYDRITSIDPEIMMPPPESNLKLSPYEKALIAKWIEQGAEYKPHWAFIPPEKPEPPAVQDGTWIQNPIDAFVLNQLERVGLKPSPSAEKERLLRRMTMDLTGLPPTLEEIDAFLADHRPDSYERVVDRLLQSDAYAERMALQWMDVSRYADSHGYHADGERMMWPWRDWVIEAFGDNMPFDQFVTWQLAGDLVPNPNREQILATGFNRNHPMTAEGGIIDEEYRMEYVVDRTNTVARTFLGLTMECARCHDHKFDPVTQKEYYQLSAFFNNVNELGLTGDDGNAGPMLMLTDEETDAQIRALREQIAVQEQALIAREAEVRTQGHYQADIPTTLTLSDGLIAHYPLDHIDGEKTPNTARPGNPGDISGTLEVVEAPTGSGYRFDYDYDYLELENAGMFERVEPYSIGVWIKPERKGAYTEIIGNAHHKNTYWRGHEIFLDSLNHLSARLTHALPQNVIHIATLDTMPRHRWTHVMLTYDGSSKAAGLRLFVNGKVAPVEVKLDNLYKSIKPVDGSYKPTERALRVARSYRAFGGDDGIFTGSMDDIRIYNRMLTAVEVAGLNDPDAVTASDDAMKLEYFLHHRDPEYRRILGTLAELRLEEHTRVDAVPEVMVMKEMESPRPTFVLDRGVYDARTEQVQPGTPEVVMPFDEDLPDNRLGLAQWLLDPKHPLTARVTVNRFWQMYFGSGLVSTPEDFGYQGSLPTHPALLDWLATTFIESGWDVKAMQKLIVMSATYQQSSKAGPELLERDPSNALLARGPSYRMPAEMIRDNALAASGLLVRKVGGASVKPYQPEGLWIEKGNFSVALLRYEPDTGDKLYRRSLYTFIRRTSPPPSMMAFDATDRSTCVVRRQSTNTPMQALVLMNDPQYVEAARVLAERMQKEAGSNLADQVMYGFRLVTGRRPNEEEVTLLKDLYSDEYEKFRSDRQAALDLLSVGDSERDPQLDTARTAAMAVVASMMINHDEAYTKR